MKGSTTVGVFGMVVGVLPVLFLAPSDEVRFLQSRNEALSL
jgi:hypothetical protein